MYPEPQIVEFVSTNYEQRYSPVTNAFEFRKDKKYHWLQKLCCKIMKKIGAHYMMPYTTIKRTTIDTQDLLNQINLQHKEVFKSFNMRPTRLVIGVEDFQDLMGVTDVERYMTFDTQYSGSDSQGNRKIFGLNVAIVPWMKGMVVLP